jgi:hypothetical protein
LFSSALCLIDPTNHLRIRLLSLGSSLPSLYNSFGDCESRRFLDVFFLWVLPFSDVRSSDRRRVVRVSSSILFFFVYTHFTVTVTLLMPSFLLHILLSRWYFRFFLLSLPCLVSSFIRWVFFLSCEAINFPFPERRSQEVKETLPLLVSWWLSFLIPSKWFKSRSDILSIQESFHSHSLLYCQNSDDNNDDKISQRSFVSSCLMSLRLKSMKSGIKHVLKSVVSILQTKRSEEGFICLVKVTQIKRCRLWTRDCVERSLKTMKVWQTNVTTMDSL